ncbi:MAG TPA: beta-ketoacyl-ACP synthase II [Alphaproteobacteria bacterium]|nr:beta-ketoacyl-ACP synthase II [Alphaproteobacteria bacterium]
MRRVVVTGIGLVSPLGASAEASWKRLLQGKSGAGPVTKFDASDLPARIAHEVPATDRWNDGQGGVFKADDFVEPKEQRRIDPFIVFALAAAQQAAGDSGYVPKTEEQKARAGVYIGSGIGGLPGIEETAITLHEKGPRRVSPFFIPGSLVNLASGQVSIRYGLKGPNCANATACATGAHAIGDAARLIAFDDADVMYAGGAEAAICRLGMAGFAACRALSTGFNDTPEKASRPYDKDRDGFVMGEGAGVLVLEELEHAKARGAKIYAEVKGYGLSGDAYHITSPSEDGDGGFRCMQMALKRAGMSPSDIDYINAHGTSTPLGDRIETTAVKRAFGEHAYKLAVSSTKSMTGHLLGGAGGVEAGITVMALHEQIAPPTINFERADPECDLDYVPNTARPMAIEHALSNSFGFGGTNGCLIFKKY